MKERSYQHLLIENKWQTIWNDTGRFSVHIDNSKQKYYILDMFPYPSGSGLHVGHTIGYVATDVITRFKRMQGFNVLHPMGWDSFGLPAEQYALRTGVHPKFTTKSNIATYKKQLMQLGLSYDWNREIATSDPDYYKWTQWIFTKLYEKGLAYESSVPVNYCPALRAVLSNEEVENGKSRDGGHPIERRALRQWVLKITEYAKRLLDDLELVDWPESVKKLQRHWIGRSEGYIVHFTQRLHCFTTRIDTLPAVTFIGISPEHPDLWSYVAEEQKEAVKAYLEKIASRSDLDRTGMNQKIEAIFTGTYADHPLCQRKLPIYIADYILMGYGTGAIMGVPAEDERDGRLSAQYSIPVEPYEEPEGLTQEEAKKKIADLLTKEKATPKTCYRLRDWLFSRQRYWGEPIPILHYEDGSKRALDLDELPLLPPELEDYKPAEDGESPLAKDKKWVLIVDPKTKKAARRETNTMPQWAGSCWYYLRFADPHNELEPFAKDAEKYWLPVDLYVGGVEHAVLHLLYARFWHKVLYDLGYVTTKEPFARLRNQGLVTSRAYKIVGGAYVSSEEVEHRGELLIHTPTGKEVESSIEKMSKSKLNGVSPDEIIEEFGADALRLYALFMGPFDQERLWNIDGVVGCRRFLTRLHALYISDKISDREDEKATKYVHRLIHNITNFIESFEFNRAVAAFMEFLNQISTLDLYPKSVLNIACRLLHPLAPHLAAECWELLGKESILDNESFPIAQAHYLMDDREKYAIQINGKIRGEFEVERDLSEQELLQIAQQQNSAVKFLEGKTIMKTKVVRGRLVSFSTDPL